MQQWGHNFLFLFVSIHEYHDIMAIIHWLYENLFQFIVILEALIYLIYYHAFVLYYSFSFCPLHVFLCKTFYTFINAVVKINFHILSLSTYSYMDYWTVLSDRYKKFLCVSFIVQCYICNILISQLPALTGNVILQILQLSGPQTFMQQEE